MPPGPPIARQSDPSAGPRRVFAQDLLPAQIRLWARPRMDMGTFVNSMDIFNKVIVGIDNTEYEMGWERKAFEVQSGRHSVSVGIRNLFHGARKKCCAQATIHLQPGGVIHLRYTSGVSFFQPGVLENDPNPPQPMEAPAPVSLGQVLKTCPGCSGNMPAVAAFCPVCGQRQAQKNSLTCTRCGRMQTEGKFCRICGGWMA